MQLQELLLELTNKKLVCHTYLYTKTTLHSISSQISGTFPCQYVSQPALYLLPVSGFPLVPGLETVSAVPPSWVGWTRRREEILRDHLSRTRMGEPAETSVAISCSFLTLKLYFSLPPHFLHTVVFFPPLYITHPLQNIQRHEVRVGRIV